MIQNIREIDMSLKEKYINEYGFTTKNGHIVGVGPIRYAATLPLLEGKPSGFSPVSKNQSTAYSPIEPVVEIGCFKVKKTFFPQVISILEAEYERPVNEEEAIEFLSKNPVILGSIVGYGEVDTEVRYSIWEAIGNESD